MEGGVSVGNYAGCIHPRRTDPRQGDMRGIFSGQWTQPDPVESAEIHPCGGNFSCSDAGKATLEGIGADRIGE